MLEALQPYFGIVLEGGLSVLLGIANGVLMFLLALFVAFFFYVYGEPIADRLRLILHRIAGVQAERLITGDRRHRPRRGLRDPRHRGGAGHPDRVRPVDVRRAAAGAAGRGRRPAVGVADWRPGGLDPGRHLAA